MKRRRLLGLSCSGLATLLAGCSDFGSRAPTLHDVGEPFVVGTANPIQYQVRRVASTSRVTNLPDGFIFVDVAFENRASRALDVYPELLSLSTAQGNVAYDYDPAATARLRNRMTTRQLQPNEAGRGQLLYPTPDADVFYLLVEPVRPTEPTPAHRVRLDTAL
jgi:hypothetical protein